MKKILVVATVALLLGGLFYFTKSAGAVDATQNKNCMTGPFTGSTTVWRPEGVRQYFQPTVSHLTKVTVAVKSPTGLSVTWRYSLKDSAGTTIKSYNLKTTSTTKVYYYLQNFDETTTGKGKYYILLERVSGDDLWWYYKNDNNCDGDPTSNGVSTEGGTVHEFGDMQFDTWGYNTSAPSNPSGGTSTTGSTSGVASSSLASTTAVPEDPSIKEPVLTSIEKNEKKTDAPITKTVALGNKDKLKAVGTSFAGAKVAILIGDQGYNADTDSNGNWSINLPIDKLKEGEQAVQGQAQKDGKGSVKKELFKVKVLGTKISSGDNTVKSLFAGWNIFCTLTAVGILLLVLMLLLLIAKRHKDNMSAKASAKKEKPKK